MEELVNKLAELQAEMKLIADQIAGNKLIQEHVTAIAELEKQASDGRDVLHDLISTYGQDILDERMNEIKDQIIDEWDGNKKTLKFGARTIKFWTTQSLKITDNVWMLGELLDHTTLEDVADKYIKGFKLTAVKKYMGVHEVPIDAAVIVYKTTAKLEQESG